MSKKTTRALPVLAGIDESNGQIGDGPGLAAGDGAAALGKADGRAADEALDALKRLVEANQSARWGVMCVMASLVQGRVTVALPQDEMADVPRLVGLPSDEVEDHLQVLLDTGLLEMLAAEDGETAGALRMTGAGLVALEGWLDGARTRR